MYSSDPINLGPHQGATFAVYAPIGAEVYASWHCGGCDGNWKKFVGVLTEDEAAIGRVSIDIACPVCDPDNMASLGVVRDRG